MVAEATKDKIVFKLLINFSRMNSIVLLHGAIGASDQLTDLRLILEKNYKVYTFDFAGHGKRSSENTDFSIEIFAADLDSFLQKQQLKHPIIFGYSMGGYVAIYHALHYANKAKKIITLATKFNWTTEIAAKEMKMLDASVIEQKIPAFALQLKNHHGKDWKNVLIKTARMMVQMGEKNPFTTDAISKLQIPIHFGRGDSDKMVTAEETELYFRAVDKSEIYVLQDTPHPIEKVDMENFASLINRFIES